MPTGHNANFVWNQNEASQKLAQSLEFLQYECGVALKQLRRLAVRVRPISLALRACFLGHYRMARMSQSASSSGLASWMRPHMVPDTHLLKLLFLTRYINCSLRLFANLLACPLGEGAERSEAEGGCVR